MAYDIHGHENRSDRVFAVVVNLTRSPSSVRLGESVVSEQRFQTPFY
jgi:hypothetical protein